MSDTDVTTQVIETLIFRLLKTEPDENQKAIAARVSAAYQIKYGPITKDTDPKAMVNGIRELVLRDTLNQLRGALS